MSEANVSLFNDQWRGQQSTAKRLDARIKEDVPRFLEITQRDDRWVLIVRVTNQMCPPSGYGYDNLLSENGL